MVGNTANYDSLDVFRALLKIDGSFMSRVDLMKQLGIGEGSIRSVLDILKSKGLVGSDRTGHFIKEKGKKIIKDIQGSITLPRQVYLSMYPKKSCCAVVISNVKCKKSGISERDIAVKNKALGALVFRNSFVIEGYSFVELKEQYKKLKKNDCLVVTFADDYNFAEKSVIAIASSLSNKVNKVIRSF